MVCIFMTFSYAAHTVAVHVSSKALLLGYMNVFKSNNGAQGAHIFGNSW